MRSDSRLARGAAAALALCAGAGSARAQVSISPTRIELSPRHPVVSVSLVNSGDAPLLIQSSALAWSQDAGSERRAPSTDLIVAPAVAEIPPHAGQVFRVRLRAGAPAKEAAYRLELADVSPKRPGEVVAFRIRHDLPVIFDPDRAKARPVVSACPAPANQICVRVADPGDRFLRVDSIEIRGQGWRASPQGGGVVLAGAWRDWMTERPRGAGGPAHVEVRNSAGAAAVDLGPS